MAATAVEQLYANVDVEQALAERLPEAQKALAPVLAGITRQGAEEAANRLLERPRLQEAWVRVATATQRQLVELLEDEGEFVSTTGGEVVLDLRPIVIELGDEVAIIGRIAQQLPESTGQIAIVSSDQLEAAQTGSPHPPGSRELALARRDPVRRAGGLARARQAAHRAPGTRGRLPRCGSPRCCSSAVSSAPI